MKVPGAQAIAALALSLAALGASAPASAAIVYADEVLDFFNSGANPEFPAGAYGGTWDGLLGTFPVAVPLSYATDGDATTFVSLPTGSYMVVGFSGGYVYDGDGLDLFISEVGGNDETASIWVSSDYGLTFTFLGIATTDTVSGFDLADIGYTGNVNAVRIVGLDNFGGSPGFDLAFVQGLEGSSVVTVPEPASLGLALIGLLAAGAARRSRSK